MATNQPKPIPQLTEAEIERFWSKVDKSGGADACWPWTAYQRRRGYGELTLRGYRFISHRIAYAICNNSDPGELVVRHRCDNPYCNNPAHLLVGTTADNIRDRDERGRTCKGDAHWSRTNPEKVKRGPEHIYNKYPGLRPTGDRNGARKHPERLRRGSDNHKTKLTPDQVVEIRRMYNETPGNIRKRRGSVTNLLNEYGIGKSTLLAIVKGECWKHIPFK